MSKIFLQVLVGFLMVTVAYSLAAQNQHKVVVIPLDSERPAIEIADSNGATIGAATAGNFVAMKGGLNVSGRTQVFLVSIFQSGFFSQESSAGVLYSGINCTGTPKTLIGPTTEFPALEVAVIGFDPEAGPHTPNTPLNEIRAFVRVSPLTTTSASFSSAAVFTNGQWQCTTTSGIGVSAVELELAADLSTFSTPFSARMR